MNTFVSDLSHKEYPVSDRVYAKTIRHSILDMILKDYPGFSHDNGCLSLSELNFYREKSVTDFLSKEMGELTDLEKTVVSSMSSNTTLADKIESEDFQQKLTFGQKVADKVATFGGSWTFIISFGMFIFLWVLTNVYWLLNKGFDPYPFILLNLILSCIAAIQAPVIMMSQNRQEEKDRDRARKDYMINLKAELELRALHEKIDHFIMEQQQELLELQKIQIDMMNDILDTVNKNDQAKA